MEFFLVGQKQDGWKRWTHVYIHQSFITLLYDRFSKFLEDLKLRPDPWLSVHPSSWVGWEAKASGDGSSSLMHPVVPLQGQGKAGARERNMAPSYVHRVLKSWSVLSIRSLNALAVLVLCVSISSCISGVAGVRGQLNCRTEEPQLLQLGSSTQAIELELGAARIPLRTCLCMQMYVCAGASRSMYTHMHSVTCSLWSTA